MTDPRAPAEPEAFSLVTGGPLYRLLLRARLARPPLELLERRVVAVVLVTWLPLLALALVDGRALGGTGLPFVSDLAVQVRLLVALPLLLAAEIVMHERLRPVVRLLVEQEIVRPADRPRLDAIVRSTLRWRDSAVVEVALVALVFTVGRAFWNERLALRGDVWFVRPTGDGPALAPAGLWYAWVSLPIVQIVLLRSWYRLGLWAAFVFRVARLDLALAPAHPDRAGGLGFFGTGTAAFTPLVVAQSVLVSAMVGSRVFQHGAPLQDFAYELGGALVFAVLQVLGPLMVFAPKLLEAKRRALYEHGALAEHYVKTFERKWLRHEPPPSEPLLGNPDVQSLADLQGVFDVIREMRPFPFGKETVLPLVAMVALPGVPLILSVVPLDELLRRLLGALL